MAEVIIPNNAPLTLIHFWEDEGSVAHHRYAILAWRVEESWTFPVFSDMFFDDFPVFCYEQRLGDVVTYIFPDHCIRDTWEEALEQARRDFVTKKQGELFRKQRALRKAWEKEHQ